MRAEAMENPKTEFTSHDIDVLITQGRTGYIIRILCEQNHPILRELFPGTQFKNLDTDTKLIINQRQFDVISGFIRTNKRSNQFVCWCLTIFGLIGAALGLEGLWNMLRDPFGFSGMGPTECCALPLAILPLWLGLSGFKSMTKPAYEWWCEQK